MDDFRTSINFNNHNCQLKFTKIIHKRLGHKQFLDSELEAICHNGAKKMGTSKSQKLPKIFMRNHSRNCFKLYCDTNAK